jgi:hypothetical protein
MAKFCVKCGKPLTEGTKFCVNCGAPVSVTEPERQPQTLKQPVPKKPMGLRIVAAILLILHTMFYAIFALLQHSLDGFTFYCLAIAVSGVILIIGLIADNVMMFKVSFISGIVISVISVLINIAVNGFINVVTGMVSLWGSIAVVSFMAVNILLLIKALGVGIPSIVLYIITAVLILVMNVFQIQSLAVAGVILWIIATAGYIISIREVLS